MILIIGYGNPLRRDDGAGPELARRLARRWEAQGQKVVLIVEQQLLPELAPELAGDDVELVLFADTDASADVPRARRVSAEPGSPSSTHHLTPERLLAMSGLFGVPPPPAWLATIPGRDFDHGEGLGAVAAAAVDLLETSLLALPGRAASCAGRSGG